jgi:predicted metal-dependent phosphoesterase TrpH/predicted ATPase
VVRLRRRQKKMVTPAKPLIVRTAHRPTPVGLGTGCPRHRSSEPDAQTSASDHSNEVSQQAMSNGARFLHSPSLTYALMMAGADFVRADLHVHTHADDDRDPRPDVQSYVDAALDAGVKVLAITDHNTVQFAASAIAAANETDLLVLPGIEISTHDGHLLALFAPEAIEQLGAFANPESLRLSELSATERRSSRAMPEIVEEIHRRGGLAIPAHVDADGGIHQKLRPAELIELISSPALAGLEFRDKEALETWFTDDDEDPHRQAAWRARQAIPELRDRGLARVMSSDAHSSGGVGRDRSARTLTRLRVDHLNFAAVRLAIQLNPKARCKAEAILPATYPRVLSATFRGGFLDGATIDFSPNLNCLIGGRGSGKSTALLAIRAALGADLPPEDDPDDEVRMPDEVVVRFIDSTGSERTAIRRRGQEPVDAESAAPIRLRIADLGQDESGRLARGYSQQPEILLSFLDSFVVTYPYEEKEVELLADLDENAAEVRRTAVQSTQVTQLQNDRARLTASLEAAQKGRVEAIAEWAALLAAQTPLLERLRRELDAACVIAPADGSIDIDGLATEYQVDLKKRGAQFVNGGDGLRETLARLGQVGGAVRASASKALAAAAEPATAALQRWQADQEELKVRLREKQTELEAQGLTVQAGAVRTIAERLQTVATSLGDLRRKQVEHQRALGTRAALVHQLHVNRQNLYERRRATVKRVANAANAYAENLDLSVGYYREGLNDTWVQWLSAQFSFRSPRVQRLASMISPRDFADSLLKSQVALLELRDVNGEAFFTVDILARARTWDNIMSLETLRLDRPRIDVQEAGKSTRKPFDHLSAGQQRSVLLSLLLCAERSEPLILDQPEDHLDAEYIAAGVVRHLVAAKERRQVIIATHSPNLTVLGDAELVLPMHVEGGPGAASSIGSVDRPETRDRVCALLEGGVDAYRKRGERYGFRFTSTPT